jgi:hypothetical protein
MKKTVTALFLAVSLLMFSITVSAEHFWNESIKFSAAHGTVNIDGKADAGEWDDAPAIDMSLNNDPLAARGFVNYQGGWETARDDSDYKGVSKIKWDEQYIYFLEERTDNYVNLNGNAEEPYITDGVLIFTQVDSTDGKMNPDGISVHIFYTVGNGDGKIGGDVKARVCNMEDGSREVIDIPDGKIASSLKAGGYTVEIAVPWSFYASQIPNFKNPNAGDIIGLSYVVHDSDTDETGYDKQFCYAVDNDMTGDVTGGYDFGGWGTVELLAAVVSTPEPEPEPAVEPETPAPEPAAPVAPAAPATSDAGVIFMFMAFAAAALIVSKTVKEKI